MNKEKMLELADFLDSIPDPDQFTMISWISNLVHDDFIDHDEYYEDEIAHSGTAIWTDYIRPLDKAYLEDIEPCNTAACIAGWTVINEAVNGNDNIIRTCNQIFDISPIAADLLGLNNLEAFYLFNTSSNTLWDHYSDELDLDRSYDQVDSKKITNKHAAKALRALVSGEFVFPEEGFC